ncbi:MAG: glycosyltransferase [Verrucomicrobia bacterium]|nr:glycosyltransferase [Verrucomicrobiota bacterium]
MEPKVSIVTPSFNQARYIEQTLLSVLEQDYPNVEHVIFDGGSKDGTLDILRRYESRGVRWTSEKDRGQSDAINKGFRAATGDIIGWINSDDWYARGAFRIVLDYFRDHPEAQWVYGNNLFTDPEGRVVQRVRTMPYKWSWLLYTGLLIPQPGIFLRRRVLEDCGLLDADIDAVMDYEWWLRIAQKHEPHFIDRYLAYFRIHEASKTGAGQQAGRWKTFARQEHVQTMQRHAMQAEGCCKGPLARRLVSADKGLARLRRAVVGPRDVSLHCAPRAVVLINLMAPYRVPLFNALHDHHDMETQVWTLAANEDRQWEVPQDAMRYPHRCLRGATLRLPGQALEKHRFVHLNSDLWRDLWRERPDVVVAAEFSLASVQAALYCGLTGAALISWSETTPEYEQHMGGLQRCIRRWLLRRASACIATSSGSREKYLSYGAATENVFVSLQTADISAIEARCGALRAERPALRQRLGWAGESVVALYVGSFIERKGLDALLKAFAAATRDAPALKLALAGGGDQEGLLRALAAELGVADRVTWLPFRQQAELWELYACADFFVLPTRRDTFGVVVLEAMAAGLPVLCSRFAGAVNDLVADGRNGWAFDPGNTAELSQRLVALARDADLRAAMGAESRQRAQVAAPAAAAAEFHRAILHGLASSRRR